MNDLVEQSGRVRAAEAIAAGQHPIGDGAERELVGAAVDRLGVAPHLLRCHVGRGAEYVVRQRKPAIGGPHLGDAEVEHFDDLVGLAVDGGQEDVGRLEVAMDHPVAVRRRQRRSDELTMRTTAGRESRSGSESRDSRSRPSSNSITK